jgi:ABC-type transport system involved in multi-copper enzyme maturation permease subunit
MYNIITFELAYRFRRPATYIYFTILFLLSFLFATTDAISIGGAVGNIYKNAPFTINQVVMILMLVGTMIISAVMGVPVYRDFEHHFHEIMFTTPVKKWQYLGGRFLGSYLTAIFIFTGILLGIFIGLLMPWVDKELVGPFKLSYFTTPFFQFILPNLFLLGAIFFSVGSLLRHQLAIFIQGILFFILYIVLSSATGDVESNPVNSIFDPFGITPAFYLTRYWTPFEKNNFTIPFESYLLWNRLLWFFIAAIISFICYKLFKFSKSFTPLVRKRKFSAISDIPPMQNLLMPAVKHDYSIATRWKQWRQTVKIDFLSTIRSVPFIAITLCGIILLLAQATNIGKMYGTSVYPVTYAILDTLTGNFFIFILVIITFYTGELIWKDRESSIHNITDALPVSKSLVITARFVTMCLIVALLLILVMLTGMLIQTINGFYRFDVDVYLKNLFLNQFPAFILLILLAFFIHSIVNNKFIGHTLMIVYFVGRIALSAMGINHKMLWYGSATQVPYSDMNGFGHFLFPKYTYLIYWGALGVMLFVFGIWMSRVGNQTDFSSRWKQAKNLWKQGNGRIILPVSLLIFILSGSFIFYNTNILHTFKTEKTQRKEQALYERKYRRYLDFNQPRITAVNIHVDLVPERRAAYLKGYYIIKNKSAFPIDTLLIGWSSDNVKINRLNFGIPAQETENYLHQFVIYKLEHSLMPGDSSKVEFDLAYESYGFSNNNEPGGLVYNGTFINNGLLPSFGYTEGAELSSNSDRRKEDLPRKNHNMRLLSDSAAVANTYLSQDADWISYECLISTAPDQIAISPGYLQKEWVENNRHYFHYKMDGPILNFYSFLSARYEVFRDRYHDINIEIYHHKSHNWNILKMNDAVKKTLAYCEKNFSSYQFKQVRILEFPKYEIFAQSFPNTIPFSEGIGFIYNVDKESDIDNAFYVTAHEVAHQWWGHQVAGANTQGSTLMVESMAQYTALMVMEHTYGKEMMEKFLKYELDRYLQGRSLERINEQPLAFNDGQGYIHYQKGSLVMYALKDYIGEETLNGAFKKFIQDYGFQSAPYVQSPTFVKYINDITPDSIKNIIPDMFAKITLFDLKCKDVSYSLQGKKYKVEFDVEVSKAYADTIGNENKTPINDWIDVGVMKYAGNGKYTYLYLQKVHFIHPLQHIEIWVAEKPAKAGIDPLHKLIDRNSEDNVKEAKVKS